MESYINGDYHQSQSFSSSSSLRHVSYSCGTCGYELNLSSSNRNTATIGSKYGKSIKRGIISFINVDESRFTQVDEFQCMPHITEHSWGFFRRRTKLLCRKCGNHIGTAFDDKTSEYPLVADGSESSSTNEVSGRKKYNVRICSLQPSTAEESQIPLTCDGPDNDL
ncbi:hypothetical protein CFOL_v3_15464 [Cephalotus follicularis]|uniref:Uncharacterized protein n=1 Tax=Cephalotus follicularis TaxID=3775 RepID=A0A1Q3BVH2_CEPFO|nr:hypothetical protein CFOL_v3_15464 [Cephalotus follicularis]